MKNVFFLIVVLFWSCNKIEEDIYNKLLEYPTHQIKIDADLEDRFQLSKVISKIEYINLEASQESVIGEVRKIIVKDDRIYLLDSYNNIGVFCFDMAGKYLFKIAKQGNGPGELLSPKDFIVTNSRIEILDDYKLSVLSYDLEGKYIDMIRFKMLVHSFSKLDKNHYVITPGYRIWQDEYNYNLMLTNQDFIVNKKYFKIKKKFNDINFQSDFQFYNTGSNSILFKMEYTNSIYSFKNSTPYLKYKLQFDGIDIADVDVNGNQIDMAQLNEDQIVYGIKDIIEIDDLLYFQYKISARGFSCFYNISTGELFNGAIDNDIDGFPFASTVTKNANKIVGVVNPFFVLTATESPNYRYKTQKLLDFAKNITELSNYIIAIYTLK